jgi:hypothetical protein
MDFDAVGWDPSRNALAILPCLLSTLKAIILESEDLEIATGLIQSNKEARWQK